MLKDKIKEQLETYVDMKKFLYEKRGDESYSLVKNEKTYEELAQDIMDMFEDELK